MKKETEKCIDRHVRITDMARAEQIDRIMKLFGFRSFNEFFNEFLRVSLSDFYTKMCGGAELPKESAEEAKEPVQEGHEDAAFYGVLVRLLKEIVLNVTINKSMLSSLFNARELEYSGSAVPGEKFSQGAFSDTPDYLEGYETRGLKNIRR